MTAINGSSPSSSADGVAWDLSDLYSGVDDPKLDSDLDSADVRAANSPRAIEGHSDRSALPNSQRPFRNSRTLASWPMPP